jgi:hypothetical protein
MICNFSREESERLPIFEARRTIGKPSMGAAHVRLDLAAALEQRATMERRVEDGILLPPWVDHFRKVMPIQEVPLPQCTEETKRKCKIHCHKKIMLEPL